MNIDKKKKYSKYNLINKIGKGSYANVYKALNTENNKQVAIKIFTVAKQK